MALQLSSPSPSQRARHSERGATLIVALISLTALLGLGMATMLTVRSNTSSGGADRFQQTALYSAESGLSAGVDFLRVNCSSSGFYSLFVTANNGNPVSPGDIVGNGAPPGDPRNPFSNSPETWYQVQILNNRTDSGLAAGKDTDGIVVLHSVGHGPNQTQVTVELEVRNILCLSQYCAGDSAQKGDSSVTDNQSIDVDICATGQIDDTGWRTANLGGL